MLRFTPLIVASAIASGCATVRVETPSRDAVDVKTGFGIVSIGLHPSARSVVAETKSFGLIGTPGGFTLGYHDAAYAVLPPDDCRIVVWTRTGEQLKELDQLLRDRTDVCVLPGPNSTGSKP